MKNPLKIITDMCDLENKIICEIGVMNGQWAQKMYACNPKEMYLIDCWKSQDKILYKDKNNKSNEINEVRYNTVINLFRDNRNVTIIRKMSEDAVNDFEDEFFDFIYIDANHSYKNVLQDLNIWYPKIKINGWCSGHDLNTQHGVKDAVIKFTNDHDLKFNCLSRNSFGIQKTKYI